MKTRSIGLGRPVYLLTMMLIALLAFLAVACGDDEDDDGGSTPGTSTGGELDRDNPFRIAVPADLTGLLGYYSGNNVNGAKAAVALINEQGGILGREVVLDIKDAQSDPQKGADLGKEMILSGDYDAIYPAVPFAAGTLAPEIARAKILSISTSGDGRMADPEFAGGYTFDLPASPPDQAASIACYVKTLPYKSVALAVGDSAYGKAQFDTWQKELPRLGIEVTAAEVTPAQARDVSAQFTKLKASNPEALLIDAAGPDLAVYFDTLKNLNWDVPVIGGNSLSTTNFEQILTSLDDLPDTITMTSWAINIRKPDGPSEAQQQAIDTLKDQDIKIEQPLYIYAFGWDVMMLIRFAAETAQSDDPAEMIKALETLGAMEDQSELGTILADHYDFSADFHGLKTVPFTSGKPGPFEDGLYEYGGTDWTTPC